MPFLAGNKLLPLLCRFKSGCTNSGLKTLKGPTGGTAGEASWNKTSWFTNDFLNIAHHGCNPSVLEGPPGQQRDSILVEIFTLFLWKSSVTSQKIMSLFTQWESCSHMSIINLLTPWQRRFLNGFLRFPLKTEGVSIHHLLFLILLFEYPHQQNCPSEEAVGENSLHDG